MSDVQWINTNTSKNQALSHPDIKGWVTINNDDAETIASDPGAEQLGDVLIYFNEISGQIGETFGLDNLDEIHLVCEELTAVCMPGTKETVGIIFDKETKPNHFLAKYKVAK